MNTEVKSMTTAELVAYYNAHSGRPAIKKFQDRATAERRVREIYQADPVSAPTTTALAEEVLTLERHVAQASPNAAAALLAAGSVSDYSVHGHADCPNCGTHLSNGTSCHLDDVNGKPLRHEKFEYCCLACGHEFGPAIPARRSTPGATPASARPEMAASLKLDRRILCLTNGTTYENACRVWKAGLVTAAQGDRLSAELYGAAKAGKVGRVEFKTGLKNGSPEALVFVLASQFKG